MPGDFREAFDVYINDVQISHEARGNSAWNSMLEKAYLIPKELCDKNTNVTVKFKAGANDITGRIVELIRTTKKIDTRLVL